jgi:2-desacetyl-2-hydroxyethyl bacteriochlorophyllide A dehydrogenase
MKSILPKSHLAALYKGIGILNVEEVPIKYPRADNCLIRVHSCGICGSDLHTYRGNSTRNTFEEWLKLGFADGHEYTGEVVAVGDNVEHITPGMRVAVECTRHCGRCFSCKRGLYNICLDRRDLVWRGHGGFSEYAMAPEQAVYPIPDILTDDQASLIEPLACALRSVHRSGAVAGHSVVVAGGGTIGILCVYILKTIYGSRVYQICKYGHQSEFAKSLGVDHTVKPGEIGQELADIAIDAVGYDSSFNDALAAVKRGGTVVLVGAATGPRTVELGSIVGKELDIKGSLTYAHQYSQPDFQMTIDLLSSGVFDPSAIITHRFPLTQIGDAFQTGLDKNNLSIKVQIKYTR